MKSDTVTELNQTTSKLVSQPSTSRPRSRSQRRRSQPNIQPPKDELEEYFSQSNFKKQKLTKWIDEHYMLQKKVTEEVDARDQSEEVVDAGDESKDK